MRPIIFAMPGNETVAQALAAALGAETGEIEHRRFPDQESYLRIRTTVTGREVMLVCSLSEPDEKILPLLFAAATLKDLGSAKVGLVAPYVAYMRQDKRFKEGEAVTSREFARLLSGAFDWIVTIDPHLHRYRSMDELYTVPVGVGHAAPVLADHLRQRQGGVFLVGPDEESKQWVSAVAASSGVPYLILRKTRHGDRDVSIEISGVEAFRGLRPVLVDDMISSGHTMEVAVQQFIRLGFVAPECLAVHGILAENALARLQGAGAEVVTTNTIPGPAAKLDVTPLLTELVAAQLRQT